VNTESPFAQSRFEFDGNHLYYLPRHLLRLLEAQRPIFLVGTRGTGKTTLLQALNWEERLRNSSLKRQLPRQLPFLSRYVGVYLKLPRIQMGLLADRLAESDVAFKASVTAIYIDLAWLQLLSIAVTELIATGVIRASADAELEEVARAIRDLPELRSQLKGRGPFTISDVGDACHALRRQIEQSLMSGQLADLVRLLPAGQIGEFGRVLGRTFASVCNQPIEAADQKWHFKVCLDEAECLDQFQQTVLNTVIRNSEWPVFPIVSSVRLPEDPTATLNKSLWLQEADRDLITLDDMKDKEFRELVEGVTTVRIRALLNDHGIGFALENVLGPLDINGLLAMILEDSSSELAAELLRLAQKYRALIQQDERESSGKPKRHRGQRAPLPIYQAYIMDRLHLAAAPRSGRQRRRDESADIRKKMVAAYLSICSELRTNVQYASADMVLQMSDKCVRDFLAQMDKIFSHSGADLAKFVNGTVPLKTQAAALRDASERKRDTLPSQVARAPAETQRIIIALATITAHIQSHGPNWRHLMLSERGRFVLKTRPEDRADPEKLRVMELLVEAAEAGYLRMLSLTDAELVFRVHTSLAAAYEFSYRGAYAPTRISFAELNRLRQLPTDEDSFRNSVMTLAEKLAAQNAEDSVGPGLFEVAHG
jgi:hypothetical protein